MDVKIVSAPGAIFKISWMCSLCTHWPSGWDLWNVMDVKTLYALTKGVGSLRNHGCEDCVSTVSTDPGGGIFGILWIWRLCTHWPSGWDLWDVMDVKTLYALTKGVGSLRCHGCEDCVSPGPWGGIIMVLKTLRALTQGVRSLRYHGCEDFVCTDQGGGIFEMSWMWRLCMHWPRGLGSLRNHGCEDCVSTDPLGYYGLEDKGVGSLRCHGCEDFVCSDQGGGIFEKSWMWRLCKHRLRGWDLWDIMDLKTLHALTQGVRSLRYHGCENYVSPDQGGAIFKISWMWRLRQPRPTGCDL